MISHEDIVFMAHMTEIFIKMLEAPEEFFKGFSDSNDLKIASAIFFLGDCYLRGKGLKMHPTSKTRPEAMEALAELWEGIDKEIEARTFLYPRLSGLIGRSSS